MRRALHWMAALLVLTYAGLIVSQPAVAQSPDIPANIASAMQDRDYPAAIKAIDAVINDAVINDAANNDAAAGDEKLPLDYLAWLRGQALHLAGDFDGAIVAFDGAEKKFPKSPWARRARFSKALSLSRKGDFAEAEKLYRQEATALLSVTRKQELASIYLEFADAYFKPKDERITPPDYQRALQFYGQALDVGPEPERQREVELRMAECYERTGNLEEARRRYQLFAKSYPESPLEIEARFRLGVCLLGLGNSAEARAAWQDLIAAREESDSPRIAEAAFRISETYGLPQPGSDPDLDLGVSSLENFVEKYPQHKLVPQAQLSAAQAYVYRAHLEQAVTVLTKYLAGAGDADLPETPLARILLGQAFLHQKKFAEAREAFGEFLARHPAHAQWNFAQGRLISIEYLEGLEKYQAKQYDAARKTWEGFLARYPLDPRNPAILYLFGEMQFAQKNWDESISQWRTLTSKYPESEPAQRAQYMIGQVLETELHQFDRAIDEYRQVTGGNFHGAAQQRIHQLTERSLSIATERVFRGDETPVIKLSTRNVERVSVRCYLVDMETYFRKMHLAQGLEQLDIALIDPDHSFEFEIPKYAQYQLSESALEVPLPKPADLGGAPAGVMAVTVSSRTLEATTMIIQSDLDVIVKSSRDEVFVFAENMRTQQPFPGVKLLLSNGSGVFAEGTTGDDGVFRGDFKELRGAEDIRVFAIAERHMASHQVSLSGFSAATGISDRGFIYSDRPAYRAGQIVHIRGIIRRAQGDQFVIDQGQELTLDVFDPRGRIFAQDRVKLGDFGSFHAHFALPAGSPVGQYRMQVRDALDRAYAGQFVVHEYQLDPVRFTIESERTVFYRGEEIEGTITAAFQYGAPLAGREIRYQLAGGRIETAISDERGQVKFKLPTRDYRESQPLTLIAGLPERNLQTSAVYYLATQGFSISMETPRGVYVAGETFEALVRAYTPEGKPLAQKLSLVVLEQTSVEGRVGQREVQRHEIETGDDGLARVTLKLEQGAQYVLRAQGVDRFKNQVSGQMSLTISGDDDTTRLRILSQRHTYKVGDTAKVHVHWREAEALALITYQGAKVLDYRLVRLKPGANELSIPMTTALAPNFELSVAVMADSRAKQGQEPQSTCCRFHESASPFVVERELNVALEVRRKAGAGELRPGEEIEVVVRASDAQGKPVSAEVSLALVERALLDRFSPQQGAISPFFHGGERSPAVRSGASITFAYRPATRGIDRRLLAEKERTELEIEERENRERLAATLNPPRAVAAGEPARAGINLGDQTWKAWDRAPGLDDLTVALGAVFSERTPELHVAQQQQMAQSMNGINVNGDGDGLSLSRPGVGGVGEANSHGFAGYSGRGDPQSRSTVRLGRIVQESVRADSWFDASDSRNAAAAAEVPLNASFSVDGRQLSPRMSDLDGSLVFYFAPNGEFRQSDLNFRFGLGISGKEAQAEAEKLAAAGVQMLVAAMQHETGYWNPAVVTDDQGQATLTLLLPDRSTAWRLIAAGVTRETLAGETSHDFSAKKEIFGELKLPLSFTDGDEAEVLVTVHNTTAEKQTAEVTLRATIGGKSLEEKKSIELPASGQAELPFRVKLQRPADAADKSGPDLDVALELTTTAGERRDVLRRGVPLLPHGLRVFATAAGTAQSDISAWVEPPAGMPVTARQLQVIVGPSVERGLLDIVLGAPVACQREIGSLSTGLESTTSDLMAGLALQKLLAGTRQAEGPHAAAIEERIRASVARLISSQNDDGSWTWSGRGTSGSRFTTARAVWALSLAKKSGFGVMPQSLDRAAAWLNTQNAALPESEFESKAILLHALSTLGQGDFGLANRLYRSRPSLSHSALTHLALALIEMDRKPMAVEILDVLSKRKLDDVTSRKAGAGGVLSWSSSTVEIRALFALALQQTNPESPRIKEEIDWLLAHRTGHRWGPDKATGPAALAACGWFAKTRFAGERYTLTVFVNERQAAVLELSEDLLTQTIEIPDAMLLPEARQRINFQLTGRGRYSFQCILSGYVAAEKLESTTKEWAIQRVYEPAQLEVDGLAIPRGFGNLQSGFKFFRNPLTQLPVGQRGRVSLSFSRDKTDSSLSDEAYEYLVVTEPLPAGVAVIDGSVKGGFESYEITPGAITFYVGSRQYIEAIEYEVHGYLPGSYRAGPAVVRDAYRPERIAVAKAKELVVLAHGKASVDEYQLTPVELYELGKLYFEQGRKNLAIKHLGELMSQWSPNNDVYRESARMLLDAHLELGPAQQVVRYFEIIKERWADLELPFEKILQVGAAYDEIGEYERSYLIFRATVEGSFQRESGVAGFLEAQGEFVRSVDVMQRLLREYPPEAYQAAATYYLAQRVYAKAAEVATDQKLREKKINRVTLINQARKMLDAFLTEHPQDPAADQASFSLANALLELEAFPEAIARSLAYERRYPQSPYLDSYWFVIGYAHFAQSQHEQALAMCRRVSEARRIDPASGREVDAANKWQAIYILGQVQHSLGRAAEAIHEYERVSDRFPDAAQAIEYFARKAIELPEVTTVTPGEAAEVELKFRNVPKVDAKVYRIDLMKYSLLKRNLAGIAGINLAGIRPLYEETIELGDGQDYRDRTKKLTFPLDKEGAFLVVCRGEALHASGLVLVTPLVVEVQEEQASGRVRTTVKDRDSGRFLSDVHVKAIGSRNADFFAGKTDLRGVYVADGLQGTSTIIAQADGDRYAFFRGSRDIGPLPPPTAAPSQEALPQSGQSEGKPSGKGAELLKEILNTNDTIQRFNKDNLDNLYKSNRRGVQVKEAAQ